jgi:hypothetical protein
VLVLPFVRRLAVAAALLIAVSLGWTMARPFPAQAGDEVQRHKHHVVDSLRRTPFSPDDLDAGLRARRLDQEFNGRALEAPR